MTDHRRRYLSYIAVVTGLVIAFAIIGGSVATLRRNDRRFTEIARESCANRAAAWDATHKIIVTSTGPIAVPDVLAGVPSEVERYRLSNERRAQQRIDELETLGVRPDCSRL